MVERRLYPRYPLTCELVVSLPDQGEFPAEAINLSHTSIQFACTPELVAALLKQQRLPYVCRLQFQLPWHQHKFDIEAHMATQRRLSQQQYVLVLLLRHDDEKQETLLDTLLAQNARPAYS